MLARAVSVTDVKGLQEAYHPSSASARFPFSSLVVL